jgi:hypothetical protein
MKTKIVLMAFTGISMLGVLSSCKKDDKPAEVKTTYFLSDIRPHYFENLNFELEGVRKNISSFRESLYNSFTLLEQQFRAKSFVSSDDLESYRLCSQYFSFYSVAIVMAYLDKYISFSDIQGSNATGLYSKLPVSSPGFEVNELAAMIKKGKEIAYEAAYVNNKYNDKTYGFYLACVQVEGRLHRLDRNNDPAIHKQITTYASSTLVSYDLLPFWNLLMSQATMSDYSDPSNTFDNPEMDVMFAAARAKLLPGILPDLGGLYPEIFGPLYRFDLTMKKIDWYLKKPSLTQQERDVISNYLTEMQNVTNFIETQRKRILDSWVDKNTYFQRKDKLSAIRSYFDNYNPAAPKPELSSFIGSKDFRRAYQCYSCHRPSGL